MICRALILLARRGTSHIGENFELERLEYPGSNLLETYFDKGSSLDCTWESATEWATGMVMLSIDTPV